MKANRILQLIEDNKMNFYSKDSWPRNSSGLQVTEHTETMIKDEVEKRMLLSNTGSHRSV